MVMQDTRIKQVWAARNVIPYVLCQLLYCITQTRQSSRLRRVVGQDLQLVGFNSLGTHVHLVLSNSHELQVRLVTYRGQGRRFYKETSRFRLQRRGMQNPTQIRSTKDPAHTSHSFTQCLAHLEYCLDPSLKDLGRLPQGYPGVYLHHSPQC